jgi:hypothetical protein
VRIAQWHDRIPTLSSVSEISLYRSALILNVCIIGVHTYLPSISIIVCMLDLLWVPCSPSKHARSERLGIRMHSHSECPVICVPRLFAALTLMKWAQTFEGYTQLSALC